MNEIFQGNIIQKKKLIKNIDLLIVSLIWGPVEKSTSIYQPPGHNQVTKGWLKYIRNVSLFQ